jgi:hypothetical protein
MSTVAITTAVPRQHSTCEKRVLLWPYVACLLWLGDRLSPLSLLDG